MHAGAEQVAVYALAGNASPSEFEEALPRLAPRRPHRQPHLRQMPGISTRKGVPQYSTATTCARAEGAFFASQVFDLIFPTNPRPPRQAYGVKGAFS